MACVQVSLTLIQWLYNNNTGLCIGPHTGHAGGTCTGLSHTHSMTLQQQHRSMYSLTPNLLTLCWELRTVTHINITAAKDQWVLYLDSPISIFCAMATMTHLHSQEALGRWHGCCFRSLLPSLRRCQRGPRWRPSSSSRGRWGWREGWWGCLHPDSSLQCQPQTSATSQRGQMVKLCLSQLKQIQLSAVITFVASNDIHYGVYASLNNSRWEQLLSVSMSVSCCQCQWVHKYTLVEYTVVSAETQIK